MRTTFVILGFLSRPSSAIIKNDIAAAADDDLSSLSLQHLCPSFTAEAREGKWMMGMVTRLVHALCSQQLPYQLLLALS